jgi:cellulose synthase operon protein C
MIRPTTLFALSLVVAGAAGISGCRGGASTEDLTVSARAYLDKRDQRSAIIQLKNVLRQNPESVEARLLLGRAMLMDNEPAGALVELRKAQELKAPDNQVLPELARAMLAMGEETKLIEQYSNPRLSDATATADVLTSVATAHALRNDPAKAADTATAALLAKPGFAPAVVLMAQLLAAKGDFKAALAELDKVLATEPTHERAGVLRGDLHWRGLKDSPGAIKAYTTVLQTHPASLGAHTALIAIYNAEKKPDASKEQFAKLKKVLPDHPETLFYEAQQTFNNNDYKATRIVTDRLLKNMPDNVRVLELAGAAEFRMEQFAPAESFLSRAMRNAPKALLPRQMLAQVYLRTGQPAKALDVLQPILASNLPEGSSWALAGEAYHQLGETKKADAAFQSAAKAEPDNAKVRTAVAISQLSRGSLSSPASLAAINDLESMAAGDATSPRADLVLIAARQRQGDFAGALKAIESLEKKQPNRALPHTLRGQVLATKGDAAAARKSFEAATTTEPGYFAAVAALATMDLSEGKAEGARQRLLEFQKANPKSHQAALAIAELAARNGASLAEVNRLTQEAVKVNPDVPATRVVLIEQLINSGDAKGALTAAQEALVVSPQNADIVEALGRAQLANNDGIQAVTTFKKLAAVQSNNPRLLVRLADAQLLTKDISGATQTMKRALEIKPDFVAAKRGLVILAMMDKRHDQALGMARDIQKDSPDDATGWLLEGDVETSRNKPAAAAAALRTALKKVGTTETAIKLHNAVLASNQRAEADRFAEDWNKQHPRDAGFRFYLGDMALSRGENAAAEGHYRSVLDLQPKNAMALNNVAWLMVQQNKPGATAMAQQAVELLNDRAPLLDTLASAWAAENKLSKAIEVQRRAVALAPNDPGIRLNLAKHFAKAGEKSEAKAELDILVKLGDKFKGQNEVAALLKTL